MNEYIWKHLPYAVYLDTNSLRSAGLSLEKEWINELLKISSEYGINLCISELVLKEWCEHIFETLERNRRKLFSSISRLKDYNIQIPNIDPKEVNIPEKSELIKIVEKNLINAGFEIVGNCDSSLSRLINEAIKKKPPFESRGKGFCDAIILESYIKHAKENFREARVIVVSNDNAVKCSQDRFKKRGITVDFLGESKIVERLKALLENEENTFFSEKQSRLEKYTLSHEKIILDYVRKAPLEITDFMFGGLLSDAQDRINGSVKSILSIRPTKITGVIGGAPFYGEKTTQDRYPIQIFVEIELDIIVDEWLFGLAGRTLAIVQPDMIDENTPITLKSSSRADRRETTKTIKRGKTVHATIDAKKEKNDNYDDFRIERII